MPKHFQKRIFRFFQNEDGGSSKDSPLENRYPIKIHITMDFKQYQQHQADIERIILSYMGNGTISSFKDIDMDAYYRKVDEKKERALFGFDQKKLQEILRYSEGDQFTIYLPKVPNKEDILQFCLEIENYLREHNIPGGSVSDAAIELTEHINLRQEFLITDSSSKKYKHLLANPSPTEHLHVRDELVRNALDKIEKDELTKFLIEGFRQAATNMKTVSSTEEKHSSDGDSRKDTSVNQHDANMMLRRRNL